MSALVSLQDGKPVTTSRIVAESFGKRHDHVLRDIDNIITSPAYRERGLPNFGETPYIDPQNGQTYRLYIMDRQGFEILAMGFTGDEALRWKFQYSDAFAAMEAELKKPHSHPVSTDALAAQLAELLKGKVLVDYQTLAELTQTLWAVGVFFNRVEPIARELEKQCGKPLMNQGGAQPAVPDYQVILETILREIDQGKYLFPFAFREIDGMPCLIVRTIHVMAHLRTTPRLRSLWDRLELKSDRVLKRTLRQAGLIVRLRFDPTINDARLPHAVAIHIAGVKRRAVDALH